MPDQQVQEGLDVRSMRMGEPSADAFQRAPQLLPPREPRFQRPPSARRMEEARARRHRERAIAAWLRDLAR